MRSRASTAGREFGSITVVIGVIEKFSFWLSSSVFYSHHKQTQTETFGDKQFRCRKNLANLTDFNCSKFSANLTGFSLQQIFC